MKTSIARREFLKQFTRGFGSFAMGSLFAESLIAGYMRKAFAQSMSPALNPSGYYVHLSLPGGPPRWYFDLPLTPEGRNGTNFIQAGFGTALERVSGEFRSIYRVQPHTVGEKTIHLPPVWNMKTANQDFTQLLQHTAFIRGVDMEINNHALSNGRQTAPVIGGYSLHGVVADRANRPMPGVVDGGAPSSTAFKSKKGFAPNSISYGGANANPVATLLAPFQNYMQDRLVHSGPARLMAGQAFKEFETFAQDRGITSSTLTAMYDNALELIEKDIFKLSELWVPTVAKYRAIVDEALHPAKGQLPGIFDQRIPSANNGLYLYERPGRSVNLSDIRDMVDATTQAPQMAENFAVAEILLDRVTSTMNLAFRGLTGCNRGGGRFTATHDQHNIGSVVSTVVTTLFYRSFLGCLTEFTSALKSKGIFDRTVLHISAEFNRSPRAGGEGSDHGFFAGNTTLISGMIGQVGVVGNIQRANYSNTYTGTFGVARNYALDGLNRPIQVNDVARTVTAMLGVDDIVTNGRPLLAPANGVWVLRKQEANNV